MYRHLQEHNNGGIHFFFCVPIFVAEYLCSPASCPHSTAVVARTLCFRRTHHTPVCVTCLECVFVGYSLRFWSLHVYGEIEGVFLHDYVVGLFMYTNSYSFWSKCNCYAWWKESGSPARSPRSPCCKMPSRDLAGIATLHYTTLHAAQRTVSYFKVLLYYFPIRMKRHVTPFPPTLTGYLPPAALYFHHIPPNETATACGSRQWPCSSAYGVSGCFSARSTIHRQFPPEGHTSPYRALPLMSHWGFIDECVFAAAAAKSWREW